MDRYRDTQIHNGIAVWSWLHRLNRRIYRIYSNPNSSNLNLNLNLQILDDLGFQFHHWHSESSGLCLRVRFQQCHPNRWAVEPGQELILFTPFQTQNLSKCVLMFDCSWLFTPQKTCESRVGVSSEILHVVKNTQQAIAAGKTFCLWPREQTIVCQVHLQLGSGAWHPEAIWSNRKESLIKLKFRPCGRRKRWENHPGSLRVWYRKFVSVNYNVLMNNLLCVVVFNHKLSDKVYMIYMW